MVTINLSLRDTALIVEALECFRATKLVQHGLAEGDAQHQLGYELRQIDRLMNRTLDEGIPAVYDALGIRVNG